MYISNRQSLYSLNLHKEYVYKGIIFDFKLIFNSNNVYSRNCSRSTITNPDIINLLYNIKLSTSFLNTNKILERIYYIVYEIYEPILCHTCNNKKTAYSNGIVNKYCSVKCSVNDIEYIDKRKNTCLERYGVENPYQSKEIQEKIKNTMIERYGVAHPIQSKEIQEKIKNTCLEKYGVENPSQSKIVQDKVIKTNIKLYGTSFYFQCNEFKNKSIDTNTKKYGVPYYTQTHSFKEKVKITSNKKYGTDHPMKSELVQNNLKNVMIEKYGNPYTFNIQAIQNKIKQTCIQKYGVQHFMQSPIYFEKHKIKLFNHKEYKFNDGNSILIQGYENIALDDLVKDGYTYNDICNKITIKYNYNSKYKVYYPDIYIKNENRIIEVKSIYTWQADLEKNIFKLNASIKTFNTELWLINNKIIYKYLITPNFNFDKIKL